MVGKIFDRSKENKTTQSYYSTLLSMIESYKNEYPNAYKLIEEVKNSENPEKELLETIDSLIKRWEEESKSLRGKITEMLLNEIKYRPYTTIKVKDVNISQEDKYTYIIEGNYLGQDVKINIKSYDINIRKLYEVAKQDGLNLYLVTLPTNDVEIDKDNTIHLTDNITNLFFI